MNFKLIRVSSNKYEVKDETNKTLYYCISSVLSLYKSFKIYDENKLLLAEIKYNNFAKAKYKLYMNGSIVDEVFVSDKKPTRKYTMPNTKWIIKEDITFTKYDVEDSTGKQLISMTWDMIDNPYVWNITIALVDKLLAVMTAVTCLSLSKK